MFFFPLFFRPLPSTCLASCWLDPAEGYLRHNGGQFRGDFPFHFRTPPRAARQHSIKCVFIGGPFRVVSLFTNRNFYFLVGRKDLSKTGKVRVACVFYSKSLKNVMENGRHLWEDSPFHFFTLPRAAMLHRIHSIFCRGAAFSKDGMG